ncbi:hypothetical protein MN116_000314, partial [Schistosoma mekongi]
STLLYIIVLLLVSIDVSLLREFGPEELKNIASEVDQFKGSIHRSINNIKVHNGFIKDQIGWLKSRSGENITIDDYVDCYSQIKADKYRKRLLHDMNVFVEDSRYKYHNYSIKSIDEWRPCTHTLEQLFGGSRFKENNKTCNEPPNIDKQGLNLLSIILDNRQYFIANYNYYLLKYFMLLDILQDLEKSANKLDYIIPLNILEASNKSADRRIVE